MEEKEIEGATEGIEKSLKGYKENIPLVSRGILTWEKDPGLYCKDSWIPIRV